MKLWPSVTKRKTSGAYVIPHLVQLCINCLTCSKGDMESAIKHLEMYVEVAERAGNQRAMARACSAIGMMYNTLVGGIVLHTSCSVTCKTLTCREIMRILCTFLAGAMSCAHS